MHKILNRKNALKHFSGKFYMSLGVSTNLAAEFTNVPWKFQCVGVKNLSGENFFSRFYASGNSNLCAERFR